MVLSLPYQPLHVLCQMVGTGSIQPSGAFQQYPVLCIFPENFQCSHRCKYTKNPLWQGRGATQFLIPYATHRKAIFIEGVVAVNFSIAVPQVPSPGSRSSLRSRAPPIAVVAYLGKCSIVSAEPARKAGETTFVCCSCVGTGPMCCPCFFHFAAGYTSSSKIIR